MSFLQRSVKGWRLYAGDQGWLTRIAGLVEVGAWPPEAITVLRDTGKLQAMLCQHEDGTWFIKRYHYSGIKKLAAIAGRERARLNALAAQELRAADVDTPEVFGWIKQPGAGADTWLVTEAISNAVNVHELAQAGGFRLPVARRWLLEQAFDLLAKVHGSGWSHGDFKWANLLTTPERDRLCLIDLDAARQARPGSATQARDLARFKVNAEEEGVLSEEFDVLLRQYCQRLGLTWSTIEQRMAPYYRRIMQRHLQK